MNDDYILSLPPVYTFLFPKLGERTFWTWERKALTFKKHHQGPGESCFKQNQFGQTHRIVTSLWRHSCCGQRAPPWARNGERRDGISARTQVPLLVYACNIRCGKFVELTHVYIWKYRGQPLSSLAKSSQLRTTQRSASVWPGPDSRSIEMVSRLDETSWEVPSLKSTENWAAWSSSIWVSYEKRSSSYCAM